MINGLPVRKGKHIADTVKRYNHFPTVMEGITLHNNGNVTSSAWDDVDYSGRTNRYVSWHYSVDDKEIVEFVPRTHSCYCSGDGVKGFGNSKTINIEINEFDGYANPNSAKWKKSRANSIKLVAWLLVQYGWGIDKVGTHKERSKGTPKYPKEGKNCPRVILRDGLEKYLADVEAERKRILDAQNKPVTDEIPTDILKEMNDLKIVVEHFYKGLETLQKENKELKGKLDAIKQLLT